MSQPPAPYDRQYNFTDYQTANPSAPLPGQKVDQELNAVRTALNDTQDRLGEIQADDGLIRTSALNIQVIAENVEPLLTDAPIQAVEQAGAQQVGLVNAAGDAKVAELEAVLTSQNTIDALAAASAAEISADSAASSAVLAGGYAGSAQSYANSALQSKNSAIVHAQVAQDAANSINLEPYATKTYVTSRGYATQSFVTSQGYLTSSALNGYATESFVTSRGYLISSDLTPYLLIQDAEAAFYPMTGNPSAFIDASALAGYATESFVTGQGYITSSSLPDVSGFMQKSSNLGDVSDVASARSNLDVYAKGEVDSFINGITPGFSDAPNNGQIYGRQNNEWTTVLPTSGGTITGNVNLTSPFTSNSIGLDANSPGYGAAISVYGTSDGYTPYSIFGSGLIELLGQFPAYTRIENGSALLRTTEGEISINPSVGITFPDNTVQTTAFTGGSSFNGGTITTPLVVQDSAGYFPNNYVNVTNDDGTGVTMVEVGVFNPSLGYSENYTKVTPGYIQLLNATFNTTISADGTLNGSPILTQYQADAMYYPSSGNPSGFITSSALAPYLTTSTASSTYFTISSAASKANLASPTFTGSPSLPTGTTAVTQTSTSNNTSIATTAFVQTLSNVKAFVSFNGTGTISIAAQKNIMSITDNGVGDYTLNFVSSVNPGYSAVFGAPTATDNTKGAICIHGGYNSAVTTKSTTALRIAAGSANSLTAVDFQDINVAIIR